MSYQFAGDWANTKIRTLLVSHDDLLWVGTVRGLYAVDLSSISRVSNDSTPVVLEPKLHLNTACGLAEDIRTLLEDPSGALWIGSHDKGLHRYQNGTLTRFSSREGLTTDRVWALHQSTDGTLWIGTEAGLYRYHDGSLVAFTRKQGLWDNVINQVLEDDDGWIWLGGDNGIHAVQRVQLAAVANRVRDKVECDLFVESDGLLSRETNGQKSQPAGWKTRDGRLWFPTTRGIAVIDPREVRKNQVIPSTVIEQVRANGQVVFGDNDAGVRRAPFEPAPGETHRLPAGQGDVVEIRYTGNHFGGADQLRFRYRLTGLNGDWTVAGNRRFAYYAHLPPGTYEFEVMAGTHHNVWDKQGAIFSFIVAPHFYERWTVRAGAIAGIGLAIFGLFAWRLHDEREKQKLREAAVLAQERSRIARNLHDEFGASLTAIRMLADLVLRESDGARTIPHLQKMSQAVIDTGQTLRQIIWTNHPSDETWRGLINRIHQYGEEFLGAAEIQCLYEEVGQPPVWPVSPNVRLELFRATKEAFHNVAKHAHASAVKLGVRYQNGEVALFIEDDGQGFDFDAQRGKGYGMTNMNSRLSQLGGRLDVQSSLGRGTKICMYIPAHGEGLPSRRNWWVRRIF
jgi:signal transduction histidine kinase